MRLRTLLAFAAALVSLPAEGQQPVNGPGSTYSKEPVRGVRGDQKIPYGLQLMARPELLPLLRSSLCLQDSSYDRSGGNGDFNNYYERHGSTAVLADIHGPGCIYRLWTANAAGHLRIFFDGETSPRIDCEMQSLFSGTVTPFIKPLVGHRSGGWYCFFPIPFARSCRVEVVNPGELYYHVQYQRFPDDTRVSSFRPELSGADAAALSSIAARWGHLGEADITGSSDKLWTADARLAPGDLREFSLPAGAHTVTALRLLPGAFTAAALRSIVLRVYWDGSGKPALEAPLGDLFGAGFGDVRYASAMTATADTGYSLFWPMPYRNSARITLQNYGIADEDVALRATVADARPGLRGSGYFHARWSRQTTVAGTPFPILHVNGRGHYVGVIMYMQGDRGISFLEGDESIRVDGQSFPSIQGTGTEDFFTGGWYFDEGPFSLAYHGCIVKDDDRSRVAAYRYQVQDCVPFQREISVDLEHGGHNDYPGADYACTAFWYEASAEDDRAPIDTGTLSPAVWRSPGAIEVETLTGTVVEDGAASVTSNADYSGGGALVWKPAHAGSILRLPLTIGTQGTYAVEAGISARQGGITVTMDGKPLQRSTSPVRLGSATVRSENLGESQELTAGVHQLALQVAGEPPLAGVLLDWVKLKKVLYPGSVEAENLSYRNVKMGDVTVQEMGAFGNSWSADRQLFFTATAPGAEITLDCPVASPGKYTLAGYFTTAKDYGVIALFSGDTQIGPAIDLYSPDVRPTGRRVLGEVTATGLSIPLTLRIVSRSPLSSGYFAGIDALSLEPVH